MADLFETQVQGGSIAFSPISPTTDPVLNLAGVGRRGATKVSAASELDQILLDEQALRDQGDVRREELGIIDEDVPKIPSLRRAQEEIVSDIVFDPEFTGLSEEQKSVQEQVEKFDRAKRQLGGTSLSSFKTRTSAALRSALARGVDPSFVLKLRDKFLTSELEGSIGLLGAEAKALREKEEALVETYGSNFTTNDVRQFETIKRDANEIKFIEQKSKLADHDIAVTDRLHWNMNIDTFLRKLNNTGEFTSRGVSPESMQEFAGFSEGYLSRLDNSLTGMVARAQITKANKDRWLDQARTRINGMQERLSGITTTKQLQSLMEFQTLTVKYNMNAPVLEAIKSTLGDEGVKMMFQMAENPEFFDKIIGMLPIEMREVVANGGPQMLLTSIAAAFNPDTVRPTDSGHRQLHTLMMGISTKGANAIDEGKISTLSDLVLSHNDVNAVPEISNLATDIGLVWVKSSPTQKSGNAWKQTAKGINVQTANRVRELQNSGVLVSFDRDQKKFVTTTESIGSDDINTMKSINALNTEISKYPALSQLVYGGSQEEWIEQVIGEQTKPKLSEKTKARLDIVDRGFSDEQLKILEAVEDEQEQERMLQFLDAGERVAP